MNKHPNLETTRWIFLIVSVILFLGSLMMAGLYYLTDEAEPIIAVAGLVLFVTSGGVFYRGAQAEKIEVDEKDQETINAFFSGNIFFRPRRKIPLWQAVALGLYFAFLIYISLKS